MAGRGRGRGRGIPIAYPDGMVCKSASTSELYSWTPQSAFQPRRVDHELLMLRGRLLKPPDATAFRVGDGQRSQDFARYSDRYLDVAVEPFHKSKLLTVQPGLHFAQELLPQKRGTDTKRARGGASGAGSSSASKPSAKRPRRAAGMDGKFSELLEDDEAVGEEGEDDDEGGTEPSKRRATEDEDEAVPTDAEESDEEDILDDGGGFDGWEDGGDDELDDDGDNEPEY